MKKVILLLILTSLMAASCAPEDKFDISGGWRFIISDDPSFKDPAFDDSSWENIDLPALLTKKKERNYIWLRKKFVLPENYRDTDLMLYLGKIWDSEETWLNGTKIGATGRAYPDFYSSWNYDRAYFLPTSLLNYGGENVISVRMFSNLKSLFNGDPFIAGTKAVDSHMFWQKLLAQYIALALGVLTLFMGLLHVIQYFFNRNEKISLHYAGISFLWFLLTWHYYGAVFFLNYNIKDNLFYAILAMEITWVYIFLENLFNNTHKRARKFIYALSGFSIIIAMTGTPTDPVIGWRLEVIGFLGIVSQVFWGHAIIKSFKKPEAKIIFGAYIIFLVCLVHDILSIQNIIAFDFYWNNLGYSAIIIAFGAILSMRSNVVAVHLEKTSSEIRERNESLRKIIGDIKKAVKELTAFSGSLHETAEKLAEKMDSQGSSIEETTASIEEVSAAIESVADHIMDQNANIENNRLLIIDYVNSLTKITSAAREASELSRGSKSRASDSIERLKEITTGMAKIKQSSGSIVDITDIINDISEQTNLLSLNASIEAARAGDQGRGFAVVAEEIGKLADRSIQQSKSIRSIILGTVKDIDSETVIINSSANSIVQVAGEVERVNSAVDSILKLCESQESLTSSIQKNIESISAQAWDIASATSEQKLTVTEVGKTLEELTSIMYDVLKSSSSLMDSFRTMQELTANLENISEV